MVVQCGQWGNKGASGKELQTMTMSDLCRMSAGELDELRNYMAARENLNVCQRIDEVERFYGKTIKVVKGRKVPLGTIGECFWMGSFDNSKYGDPWGIYTTVRIGLKTPEGQVYWTALNNVEVVD